MNILAPRARQPAVWKYLNFWRDCFSVSDIVLTAHGGGEGLACRSGIEATFPEQPAQIRVFLKELTNIMKQNASVPTAHDKHSSRGRNTDAE